MKLIRGERAQREQELLEALFTPGDRQKYQDLKERLMRRGGLRAVDAEPADDNIKNAPDDAA